MTLGIEHQVSPHVAVSVRFVHKQLDKAVEDIGAVDQDGVAEPRSAVDEAMPNGADPLGSLFERRNGLRSLVGLDDGQLQAGRAGVDDEDPAQNGQVQSRTSG